MIEALFMGSIYVRALSIVLALLVGGLDPEHCFLYDLFGDHILHMVLLLLLWGPHLAHCCYFDLFGAIS